MRTGAASLGSRSTREKSPRSPGPLPPTDLLLVSKKREIYKPGNLMYALSIRINLDSPYLTACRSRHVGAAGCCPITRTAPTRLTSTRCSPTRA